MTSSPVDERLVEIAQRFLRQTRDGKARWSTTDNESDFLYSGSQSSVLLSSNVDSDGDRWVYMKILNPRGTEVGTLKSSWSAQGYGAVSGSDDPWASSSGSRYKPGEHNKLLEDLYEAARRSALNIDEVLDSLFHELE